MSCFFLAVNSSSVMMPESRRSLYFLISATASVGAVEAAAAAATAAGKRPGRSAPPTANAVRRSRPEGGGLRPVYRSFPGVCGGRLDFCDFKR